MMEERRQEATSAFRERDPRTGRVLPSAAWWDLDEEERAVLFDELARDRRLEAALDPDGRSSTVRAVLARITG